MAKRIFKFDPWLVAHLEAAGWRAYYNRDWWRMLRILIQICRQQFKMPWPMACTGAYYATRAAIAWVPTDHNLERVRAYYTKFYRLARRYCGLDFDATEVARLEVEYSEVHRQLSGQPDKSEFVRVLTELHAAVFGLSLNQAHESAEWRVEANNTVDLITNHTSANPAEDWAKLENYLHSCYQAIQTELNKKPVSHAS